VALFIFQPICGSLHDQKIHMLKSTAFRDVETQRSLLAMGLLVSSGPLMLPSEES
jgi:hypothetical protein